MKNNKHEKELMKVLIDPVVDTIVKKKPHNSIESDTVYTDRIKNQIKLSYNDFKKRFEAGIQVLKQHGKWPEDKRFENVLEFLHNRPKFEEKIDQFQTLQEVVGFSDDELTTFYTEGCDCYHRSSYEEASHIFLLLTQLNPKIGLFWNGLGGAEEKLGNLHEALYAFAVGCELESSHLNPYLHVAKCFLLLDKKDEAKKILLRAIDRAEKEPQLKEHKNIVEKMLKAIN